ncbi:unnamed protein product [Closterium sp. NIES-54]
MDVWGPARVCGQGHERYFLLVVDDYSRYTTVFPLHSKGEVTEVLIDWIRGARRRLSESFGSDLPVLRLHSDRGGEFSSDLLRAFCRLEGIHQTFTLPASSQQNGIAERRIGMINLQPRVSLPETTPTLRWTGKVGDASAFRVWGSRAFVRDTTADKLSSHAVPCVFLGFPPNAPEWQFYHPASRRVLSTQDVTFDESVSYYRLFPYRTASPPPPRRSSSHQPVEVAVASGAARDAYPSGARPGGAELGGVAPEGTASGGAEPACADSGGGAGAPGGSAGAGGAAGATGATGGTGAAGGGAGAGAAGGAAGAGGGAAAGGGAGAGAGAAGGAAASRGGAAAGGASGTGDPGAVLGSPPSPGPPPPFLSPPPVQSQSQLQLASPLPGPSPYSGPTRGLTKRREPESRSLSPESCSASPVRPIRAARVSRPRLPLVPGTHSMTLRPSTAPQGVPLPSPPASSLPDGPDPESDSLHAASPTVTRFLATAVTDPLFESTAASALVTELVDFAAACRLDYGSCGAASWTAVMSPYLQSTLCVAGESCVLGIG